MEVNVSIFCLLFGIFPSSQLQSHVSEERAELLYRWGRRGGD